MSLGRRALRGGAITLFGQWARYAVQLVSIVALARLLDPRDFGVIGMVWAIIALGEVVRDAGLSNGAIQRDELSREEQSTLFYVTSAIGAVICGLAAMLAIPLSHFYHESQVAPVTLAMSVIPLAGGVAAQHLVDLTRAFRFAAIASADVISMIVATVLALTLAALGAGVWALVALQVSQAVVRLFVLAVASNFKPGRPAPLRDVIPILRFGRNLFVAQMLDYASRNFDNIIIGRTAGTVALGLYSRAYQLLMLPLQQINAPLTRVALPVLSQLKNEPERFRSYLRSATVCVAYSGCAAIVFSVVFAPEIVDIMLGPQWSGAADLFRALAVAGAFQTVGYVAYWIFLALDRTRHQVQFALITKPVMLIGFVIGAHWGATGVAVSYSIVNVWSVPLSVWMACRGTFVSAREIFAVIVRATGLAGLVTAALVLARDGVLDVSVWIVALAALGLVATALAYVPAYAADVHGLRRIVGLVRSRAQAAA
jgi:O-antigen/teichoic acid export membrane protein